MFRIENTEVLGWDHAIRGMHNQNGYWDKNDSGWTTDGYTIDDLIVDSDSENYWELKIGPNDQKMMMQLSKTPGEDRDMFLKMIIVYLDITAPMYWWQEFDIENGIVALSCNTLKMPFSNNEKRTVMLNYNVLANIYSFRVNSSFCVNSKLKEWHTFCEWIESLPFSELIVGEWVTFLNVLLLRGQKGGIYEDCIQRNIQSRDEALFSFDEEKIKAYAKINGVHHFPKEEDFFWAAVCKAICNITNAPSDVSKRAFEWLKQHNLDEEV